MQKTFYLVATLIEMSECVSDSHALFETTEKAYEHFKAEIKSAAENFEGQSGETVENIWGYKEWRNLDGYGYTVTIEEMTLQ